jgi:signal peptidase I
MSAAAEPHGEPANQPNPCPLPTQTLADGTPRPTASLLPEDPALSSATEPGAPSPTAKIHRHGVLQAFQSLVYIVIIALFIITFSVQPFRIPSESMEPTLLVGDFLLVDKEVSPEVAPHVFAPTNQIHRGDLVVFHYPVDPSLHLVKRVIGLPGEHIRLRDGHAYVDGHALSEPYAVFRPSPSDSYRDDFPRMTSADPGVDSNWWIQMRSLVFKGELTIPSDSYFVLGDNRNDSEDSRYWGFVPRDAIVGKPFLIYFSLNSAGSTSGQTTAAAMPSSDAAQHPGPANSIINFVRWDRAMRTIH